MEKEFHKFFIPIDAVVLILIEGWDKTMVYLRKREEFHTLKQNIFNQVAVEFLIFYLYYFDIILEYVYSDDKHDDVLNEILFRIVRHLGERDDYFVRNYENWNHVKYSTAQKLGYVQKYGYRMNLSEMLDNKLKEYSGYKYFISVEKDGGVIEESKKNVQAAFSARIAKMVKNAPFVSTRSLLDKLIFEQIENYKLVLESKGMSKDIEIAISGIMSKRRWWLFSQFGKF
jgi:hypothetical protein